LPTWIALTTAVVVKSIPFFLLAFSSGGVRGFFAISAGKFFCLLPIVIINLTQNPSGGGKAGLCINAITYFTCFAARRFACS
jgi:hypothetical protein